MSGAAEPAAAAGVTAVCGVLRVAGGAAGWLCGCVVRAGAVTTTLSGGGELR
ncbi:MAG TPA: hypothetical protein VHQ99_08400 [Gaiellaceae bacterium]|nr:hypothetical protein [Gaiellaceae bacterium]